MISIVVADAPEFSMEFDDAATFADDIDATASLRVDFGVGALFDMTLSMLLSFGFIEQPTLKRECERSVRFDRHEGEQ